MSEFKSENGGKPEPSFDSRNDASREGACSPEANPAYSPEESRAEEEDDGWREADFQINEEENEDLPEMSDSDHDELDHEDRRNRRKNRPRPVDEEGRPDANSKRLRQIRKLPENSLGLKWDQVPELSSDELVGSEVGLWDRRHRPERFHKEFTEVIVNLRTQYFMKEFLKKISDFKTGRKKCDFLTQAWEFEECDKMNEACIQPLKNDDDLNAQYYHELVKKIENPDYCDMRAFRQKLPAHKMKDKIVQLINNNQVCFISGGTGCGKTTQIVQFVLDDWIMNMNGSKCNIVCTQPRRISAFSVARRIADERFEPLSHSVGYQIRLEKKLAKRKVGCINFLTTGVFLQWLVTDPLLPRISHVFLDEVHEKTIDFEAVLALLKSVIKKRPDLKVILMSATIDSDTFCKYFDGAPDLEIPGYTFPVEDIYLDDIISMTNYKVPKKEVVLNYDIEFGDFEEDFPRLDNLIRENPEVSEELNLHLVAHLIGYICLNEGDGAILVFLPGFSDIMNLKKNIECSPWYTPEKYLLLTAHSLLPADAQRDVFTIPSEGERKIVLATSIMETSVTLDDMTYVVDCGKIKCCNFNATRMANALETTWVSRANAEQRRGRVGRTKPGKCYKLYTKDQEKNFVPYPPSDVQMNSLGHVILKTKLMKIEKAAPFMEKMMDPPHPSMVEAALKELKNINALNDLEQLTPLGYRLSKLPLDVRTGKMIIMAAFFSCIDPIFSIAACLSFKDPFNISLDEDKIMEVKNAYSPATPSDHLIFSEIVKDWENESPSNRLQFCSERYLSDSNLQQISEVKRQFAEVLYGMNFLPSADVKDPASNVNSRNQELVKAILCAGLYPCVATLAPRTKNKGVLTSEGQFAIFHGKSYLSEVPHFEFPFFVYFYKLLTSSRIFLHDATMIEVLPLLLFGRTFEIIKEQNHYFVHVDDKIKFKIGNRSARWMKGIRDRLDRILGEALLNGQGFDWNRPGMDIEILSGVVEFITSNSIMHKIHGSF